MSCLTDYIGLKICGNETSPSSLFLNSLEGISIELMDNVAEAEQITFKGVWSDMQVEAWAKFYNDFISETNKCFDINPYCDYEGLVCSNLDRLAVAWKYLLGAQLMLYRMFTPRLNFFTTVTRDEAKELLAHYQVEYRSALENAIKFIDVSACTECMECGGAVSSVYWLP